MGEKINKISHTITIKPFSSKILAEALSRISRSPGNPANERNFMQERLEMVATIGHNA